MLTTANIIELLKDKKFVIDNSPSNTTLYRYISDQRPKNDKNSAKERRAFEAPHAASLWQTDVMYGPYITVKGKNHRCHKQQTYLVAIIDDHSRLCCHAEFYLEQSIGSIVDTFKKACQKRGVPERLYCDHGKVFTTSQLTRIGALISTVILHPEVGDPAARGKVERFFRTVRDSFLNKLLNLEPPKNLLQLNEKFSAWVETSYNNKHHSGINQIPMQKWLLSAHNVRLLPLNENIDLAFMLEVTRKVKKDGTFSLNSIIFEITSSLAGKSIHIRYSPFDLSRAYVYCENEFFGAATVLSKSDNNNRPRK
ncbi:MAG: DDE-type integrase/transposase/recombinase [bacterium]